MMEKNIEGWIAVCIVITIFGFLIRGGVLTARKESAHKKQGYEECKTKVADLEWCFKTFQPQL